MLHDGYIWAPALLNLVILTHTTIIITGMIPNKLISNGGKNLCSRRTCSFLAAFSRLVLHIMTKIIKLRSISL